MKAGLLLIVLTFSFAAQAESLINCRLFKAGKLVEEVDSFTIDNYSSNEPEADIDGGLLDFSQDEQNVYMSFSNECDNMYEVTFSNIALTKAVAGNYKIILGKATIGNADMEEPVTGILKCTVRN